MVDQDGIIHSLGNYVVVILSVITSILKKCCSL